MIERIEAMLVLAGMLASTTIVITIINVWYKTRRAAKPLSDEAIVRLSAQMEDLHRHLDSVAIEVERIAEGQRFTTRLLSERAESLPRGP